MNKLKPIICPSLLSSDFAHLAQEANKILELGADWLHIDCMDGHFVNNLTIGPPVVKSLRKHTKGFLDCHLMICNPEKWIEPFCDAGADNITFHYEATKEPKKVLQMIKSMGKMASIVIKPKTPVESLFEILDDKSVQVDMVLIMTVEPGFGGQEFMKDMMPKVKTLRQRYPNLNIQVDGGINEETIEEAAKAGANVIVSGSGIYKAKDMKQAMENMRNVVKKYLE